VRFFNISFLHSILLTWQHIIASRWVLGHDWLMILTIVTTLLRRCQEGKLSSAWCYVHCFHLPIVPRVRLVYNPTPHTSSSQKKNSSFYKFWCNDHWMDSFIIFVLPWRRKNEQLERKLYLSGCVSGCLITEAAEWTSMKFRIARGSNTRSYMAIAILELSLNSNIR
jgi:hypothetical protein